MNHPTSAAFEAALTQMHSTTAAALECYAAQEAEYRKQIAACEGALIGATKQYLASGIGIATKELKKGFELLPGKDAKDYFKSLANELNRPFLFADEGRWQRYSAAKGEWVWRNLIELTVPGVARLKNVVAGLNLVAKPNGSRDKDGPLLSRHSDRVWRFDFMGGEGEELFASFVEQCANDPVMRITLNLGPKK